MRHIPLPIDQSLPALRRALREGTGAVLQAPPGAGKTTRVPLALLEEPWLSGRRIVMLEPRRLAARAAARRMSDTLGEQVGETVGYRVRHESAVGRSTRVIVVTEGVLTRMLQSDPAPGGVRPRHLRRVPRAKHPRRSRPRAHAPQPRAPARRPAGAGDVRHAGCRPGGGAAGRRAGRRERRAGIPGRGPASAAARRHQAGASRGLRGARSPRRRSRGLLVFLPGAGEIRRVAARARSDRRRM